MLFIPRYFVDLGLRPLATNCTSRKIMHFSPLIYNILFLHLFLIIAFSTCQLVVGNWYLRWVSSHKSSSFTIFIPSVADYYSIPTLNINFPGEIIHRGGFPSPTPGYVEVPWIFISMQCFRCETKFEYESTRMKVDRPLG